MTSSAQPQIVTTDAAHSDLVQPFAAMAAMGLGIDQVLGPVGRPGHCGRHSPGIPGGGRGPLTLHLGPWACHGLARYGLEGVVEGVVEGGLWPQATFRRPLPCWSHENGHAAYLPDTVAARDPCT